MAALNLHELEFSVLANHFYHDRAERIFTYLADGSAALQIFLLALAGVASISLPPSSHLNFNLLTPLLILITGCVTGVTVGLRLSDRKAQHGVLNEAWMELLEEVRESQEVDLERLNRRFHQLNRKEPPCNDKRLNWAYEKACVAMGLEPVGTPHAT